MKGAAGPGRITWLGHSTVLLELGGAKVLTDPVLHNRLAHLVRVVDPVDHGLVRDVDLVLVSHLHHDHFDNRSLRMLDLATALIVPRGAGFRARRLGFRAVTELAAGVETEVGGVRVTAVTAIHDGRRTPRGAAAEALGYVIEGGGARVYFAGDTDLFEGMAELADPPLDAALVPIWGWGPTLGPGHLDPRRAAQAVALLRPRLAVPIHWGTLYPRGLKRVLPRHLREPPELFRAAVAGLAPETRVEVMAPGGSVELG